MTRLIEADRSIILAADVAKGKPLCELLGAVAGLDGIGAVKLGLRSFDGLGDAVQAVRGRLPNAKVIIDMQKGGNDIPDTGEGFAEMCSEAGAHAAILFPFAGPLTQRAWTRACQEAGLVVLTGGMMTHDQFLGPDGGYIMDNAPMRIMQLACELDVRDFVVPGNNIRWVEILKSVIEQMLGDEAFWLYAPGFVTQEGDISECGKAAGSRFHPIVGSGIYRKESAAEMRAAAERMIAALA